MDRNDRRVAAFTMLAHPMFHAYELVIPIFVVIWLSAFDTSAAVLGVIVGISYALVGVGALPSGILADHFSSKYLIVLCMLGMGGSFILVGLAPNLYVLALALVLWGTAASIYHPAGLALISRSAKARGTVFAYHGAAGNVGVATGPLLAAILLVFFHWRTVAILLVIPVIFVILLAVRLEFDETAGSHTRGADPSSNDGGEIRTFSEFISNSRLLFTGGFVLVFVMGILYGMYFRGAITFLPEILAALPLFDPIDWVGRTFEPSQYVFSGLLLLGGIGQYVGGRLVDKIHVEYALIGGYLALIGVAVVFIPATNAGLLPLLVVGGALGFLVFMIAPINQEAISKYSSADVRGLSFGYTYTAIFGVGAIGAVLAGFILTHSTAAVLFLVMAALVAVGVLVGVYLVVQTRPVGILRTQ